MMKKNKGELALTSLVILLPIVFGLVFWDRLPEQVATHWGPDWTADGWSDRRLAVFGLPVFILIAHWFCVFCTSRDPKGREQSHKIVRLLLWICPVTSLVTGGMIYSAALGKTIKAYFIVYLLIGALFIVIGNYLPKCTRNHTIGIRLKWTMDSEENWNATHRFAGKVWAVGGVLMMGCSFFPEVLSLYVFLALFVVLSLLSGGYSYYYFKTRQGSPSGN